MKITSKKLFEILGAVFCEIAQREEASFD